MQTLKSSAESLTEVNRSKFITYLVPMHAFEGLQGKLKAENPKASHVVYALRYLNTYGQVVENSSDDGEPKGCAGVPALNVLRGKELINCAVLIVRYFGGIKLGTGGMARAYAQAVKDVVETAELQAYKKQLSHTFETSYSEVEKTLYRLKQLDIVKYERAFGVEGVTWTIESDAETLKAFLRFL
ncbi:YigZ family protein [Sulfurovum sp.]|jgi:uncharacterized YigZ family protein|uniref:IMPACT family protein n=1 Tax=Sulfurovum sp. TaxID=1969726 RepID=UPI002A35E68F|nr:YigZ family protein [Sulfurovum sp.]MDD2451611.1 YigZ family protein [Sulfurovum sp.]MDY0402980.1 YigZ family protein [Sulfurovum sp.]